MELAERIRITRKVRQMTQEDLAQRAGMSLRAFRSLERGEASDPHYSTLVGIANALDISVAELIGEPILTGKAEALEEEEPGLTEEDSRTLRLAYVNTWATFVDELTGDMEEWKYSEMGAAADPADLSEDDFLLFLKAAMPFVWTYRRVYGAVYTDNTGLLSLLNTETALFGMSREIERFERAFRRFSRVMLSVATERVEQRIAQLVESSTASAEEKSELIDAASRFAQVREAAANIQAA